MGKRFRSIRKIAFILPVIVAIIPTHLFGCDGGCNLSQQIVQEAAHPCCVSGQGMNESDSSADCCRLRGADMQAAELEGFPPQQSFQKPLFQHAMVFLSCVYPAQASLYESGRISESLLESEILSLLCGDPPLRI